LENAHRIPRNSLVAYFETSGPKLGRDYSDCTLEADLDASLNFITSVFHGSSEKKEGRPRAIEISSKKCMRPDSVSLPHPGKSVFISASLMCANLCRLEMEVRTLELSGTDYLHLDIMDAVFTPNMPLGFETIRQLREITALPLDAHLMVHNNDYFVQRMADLGVNLVSVHVESSIHLERTLTLIQSLGMKSGVALNPATPLHALEYVLDRVDFILIMMVNPGFAGQPLIPSALKKIADCRRFLEERGLSVPIQVDGNVSFKNIPLMVESGADILVAGSSSAFHPQGAILDNMKHMHDLASTGLNNRTCLIKKQ
jgi:ribulose-phosphate 3-epimerase